jgi:competence protein ComEC
MGIAPIPAVVAFTAGVLAVHALPSLPPAGLLALASVPALMPWRGRGLWALAVLGALLTVWRAQSLLDERWPAALHASDHVVEGRIASLPEGDAEVRRFLFAPRDARWPRRIRVAWYRVEQGPRGGECWRLTLRLRAPHGSLNPGGFDYEGWLFRQGIGATATVRDADRCVGAPRDRILEWRQRIVDAIHAALPAHPAAGLVAALTVGDRAGIADADWDVFRETGTTHLVAISGFNVAIIAAVAWFLGRWLWALWPPLCLWLPAQRAGLLGSALVAGVYALLAGFEPPVQRAVLMLWIGLAALWSHRLSQPARVLAVAWLAVLLLDPFAILSPGLWLSFGAVAAIFYVSLGRLRPPGLWHGLVLLQLLIAVALAPLTLFFFQGASWIGPVVNLVAVPFFAVLTPWALGALLLYLAVPALGAPLLQASAFTLQVFRESLQAVVQLPELWLPASPPATALVLALAGVVLLFAPRGLPLRPLALLCLLPLVADEARRPPGALELTALDVGQGLAVVVRTAQHTLLYDAGPAFDDGFDAGESVVAPFLLSQGLREIDLLLLSHGDRDHSGGVDAVRQRLRVRSEIGTAQGEACVEGRRWRWDGVGFEILNGPAPGLSDNDGGCVLLITAPALTALLPADIEKATEARLVAEYGGRLRSDVLVAPHHGSKTSSTEEFVATAAPQVVIHGAGWRNHFRHPRPEVVARYAAAGATQYVTGNGGAVTLRQRADGRLEVHEFRREARRFWNAEAGP